MRKKWNIKEGRNGSKYECVLLSCPLMAAGVTNYSCRTTFWEAIQTVGEEFIHCFLFPIGQSFKGTKLP